MGVDLEKLSPAPWEVKRDRGSGGFYIPSASGFPMLLPERDTSPVDFAALEFAALARNAFEVMMKRGWAPEKFDDVWIVRFPGATSEQTRGRIAADPFTALVEADRWYRENVEKSGVVFLGEEP